MYIIYRFEIEELITVLQFPTATLNETHQLPSKQQAKTYKKQKPGMAHLIPSMFINSMTFICSLKIPIAASKCCHLIYLAGNFRCLTGDFINNFNLCL